MDETLGRQDADRLAIGGAGDLELLARGNLPVENFAGRDLAGDDADAERPGDGAVQAQRTRPGLARAGLFSGEIERRASHRIS
jgi:hypothetical protein